MDYIWLKALHVAAVLMFAGGLFVQAIGVVAGAKGATETVGLVSRWDQRVTLPAMLIVWLTGALIAAGGGWFSNHWLWAKLVVVIALTGLHGVQSGRLRKLRQGVHVGSSTQPFTISFAIAGAVSIIAILAVAKPF